MLAMTAWTPAQIIPSGTSKASMVKHRQTAAATLLLHGLRLAGDYIGMDMGIIHICTGDQERIFPDVVGDRRPARPRLARESREVQK